VNYFYLKWNDSVFHVYCSKMCVADIELALRLKNQRSLLSYEEPAHPIYMMGTLQYINGQYLAKKNKSLGQLESWGIYDCEKFLEIVPTIESVVDLSPTRSN